MVGLRCSRLRLALVVAIACWGCHESGVALQSPDPGDPRFSLRGAEYNTPISGAQEWALAVDLPASSYIRIIVDARGVRLGIRLVDSDGQSIDLGRTRSDGPTPVSLVSESVGIHTLILRCLEDEGLSGFVDARVAEMGPAKQGDRDLIRAERLFSQAEGLRFLYEAEASRQAIEVYETASSIWIRAGDLEEAARARQGAALTHEQIGGLQSSLRDYSEALELSRRSGLRQLESEMLTAVGIASSRLGDPDRAGETCRTALSLAHDIGSRRAEAEALFCLAEVDYHRGNFDGALVLYRKVEPLWRSLGDRRGLARSLYYMGTVFSDLSDLEDASSCLSEALHLWRVLEDPRGEAVVLAAMGRLNDRRAEHQSALNCYNDARNLVEPMGDIVWEANILGGMGTVYENMADHQKALEYWIGAVDLYEKAGLPTAVVDSLIGVGQNQLALGDHAGALVSLQRALETSDELGDQRLSAYALTDIGRVHQSSGEPRAALEYFQRSLDLQRTVDDLRLESATLGNIGLAHQDLDEYVQAAGYFSRSLALSRSAGDRLGETAALFNMARVAGACGDAEVARGYLEECLEIAERLRTDVNSHVLRNSYFASIQQYYEFYIDLLMTPDRLREGEGLEALAFQVSERARARSLSESLAEAGVDIRHGVDPELLRRERRIAQQLDRKSEREGRLAGQGGTETEAADLAVEISDLTTRYDQLQAEIRSRSPRYAALTQPRPLSLDDVQRQILDDETLLLEYSLGEERSFLWAIAKGDHVSFELAPRKEIEELSREVYGLLTARIPKPDETVRDYRLRVKDADSRYWEVAGRLSEILLGPVADRLHGKRIVVVSDGAMQYVPFAALPTPGGTGDRIPLIVSNEVVNLPSVSALGVLRQQTHGRKAAAMSLAVLADPVFELDDPRVSGSGSPADQVPPRDIGLTRALRNLVGGDGPGMGIPRMIASRREADAILAMAAKGTTFRAVDFDASRATAMGPELGRYRIVHFATHGFVDNEEPGLSGVVLSMVDQQGRPQNGFLRLHDIYNLDLPVDLVVLSACDSALGKPVDGEGLVGIVRGFMTAGARSVVASLWKVDDEATGELMVGFYRQMLQGNQPPSAALRSAQLEMWRQNDWHAPFYWAAFILQGEWL